MLSVFLADNVLSHMIFCLLPTQKVQPCRLIFEVLNSCVHFLMFKHGRSESTSA